MTGVLSKRNMLNLNKDVNHNLTTKCGTGLGRNRTWKTVNVNFPNKTHWSILRKRVYCHKLSSALLHLSKQNMRKIQSLACKRGISMNTSVVHHQNNPECFGVNLRYLYFRWWKWIHVTHCDLKSQTSTTQMASCWLKLSFLLSQSFGYLTSIPRCLRCWYSYFNLLIQQSNLFLMLKVISKRWFNVYCNDLTFTFNINIAL